MKFTKMVATGNDFIMIDNRKSIIRNRAEFARKYCCQHFGIGADGAIFIENPPYSPFHKGGLRGIIMHDVSFRMRIFNPDGSEAEMCGNGARCAARFAYLTGIVGKPEMRFQTLAGIISATVVRDGARIGMREPAELELDKKLPVGKECFTVHYIDTGVPHTVLIRKNIGDIDIMKIAPPIRYHKAFPKGTNVDFIQIVNRHRIKMRTYERGVEDETFACGTGAVAAATVSSLLGHTKPPVEVVVKGGLLKVGFEVKSQCSAPRGYPIYRTEQRMLNVTLEGEVKVVYEGEV